MIESFSAFQELCQKLSGETLRTDARRKPFTVEIDGGHVFFVPESGKRRRANPDKTERVLATLARSGDWSPGKYQQITFHASYILAIARRVS